MNSCSASASAASQVRLYSHAVATIGSARLRVGRDDDAVTGEVLEARPLVGIEARVVLHQDVATLEDPDLHRPRDRLGRHASTGGAGWWGPDVGGSDV